jgi:hypothetical protein
MSGDPPDHCHADMVGTDRAVDRWRCAKPLAMWHTGHVRCTSGCPVIFSQRAREILESNGYVRCTRDCPVVSSLVQLLLFLCQTSLSSFGLS